MWLKDGYYPSFREYFTDGAKCRAYLTGMVSIIIIYKDVADLPHLLQAAFCPFEYREGVFYFFNGDPHLMSSGARRKRVKHIVLP
ncbi:hypothetical protein SDC9_210526 [bioreactor metagenome]|uniref:Uncharacterized protein n=1 Tax=bioreactor metagenome TaxID=1076179 RepID=A0A645JU32_9ZZZZ